MKKTKPTNSQKKSNGKHTEEPTAKHDWSQHREKESGKTSKYKMDRSKKQKIPPLHNTQKETIDNRAINTDTTKKTKPPNAHKKLNQQ